MKEEYKDITYRNDLSNYKISNMGNIYNKESGKILKGSCNRGYKCCTLTSDDGKRQHIRVHILVAQEFLPNPDNKPVVNHIDENKMNARLDNLEWVTHKENSNHGSCQDRGAKHRKKPVNEYDLEGHYIRTWKSASDIGKYTSDVLGLRTRSGSGIQKMCGGTLKRGSVYNRQWRYYTGDCKDISPVEYKRKGGYTHEADLDFSKVVNVDDEYLYNSMSAKSIYAYFMDSENLTSQEKAMIEKLYVMYRQQVDKG